LKNYLIQYKPFLLFLGKFALTYLVLTLFYQGYLNQFDEKTFEVDGFTQLVANQTEQTLLFFNGSSSLELHESQPCVKLFYNQKYVARIVEGCNALSVIILFIAFIVAFTGKLKHTVLYIIGGSLLIHILNVARIALLAVLIYHFPEQEPLLHGVIFPLFIYGVVFVLWVIWVNKFSLYAKKDVTS
jgi:exosortase family protein XrtF